MEELALVRKKAKATFFQEIKDIGKTLLEFVVKKEINGEFVRLSCTQLSMAKTAPEVITRDRDPRASLTPEA